MAHSRTLEDFKCQVCQKNFTRKCHLISHKSTAQHYVIDDIISPKIKKFECSWCNFQSDENTEIETHTLYQHPQIKNPLRVSEVFLSHPFSIFTSLPKFQCPFQKCKTKTYSKDTMRSHFYYVHKSPETFEAFLENSYTVCVHCKSKIKNFNHKKHSEWCKNIQR